MIKNTTIQVVKSVQERNLIAQVSQSHSKLISRMNIFPEIDMS